MTQIRNLVDTLKSELRRQGYTYADCADWLKLSEASVKRLFARRQFTLERLECICHRLGMDFSDLVRVMTQRQRGVSELSEAQELALSDDLRLLLVAVCLLNHWQPEDIVGTYRIEVNELQVLLGRLDRIGLIELLPGNRVRLAIERDFSWRAGGPIQRFFDRQVQAEFLRADFSGPGDCRLVVNGMLSEQANAELQRRLRCLAADFNQAHLDDLQHPLDQRAGTTLMLALRPWEPSVFEQLRR